jgi:hypothetical protein
LKTVSLDEGRARVTDENSKEVKEILSGAPFSIQHNASNRKIRSEGALVAGIAKTDRAKHDSRL